MLSVSFDPIFASDDIPIAPLSVSGKTVLMDYSFNFLIEEKLLKKASKLAQMFESKQQSDGASKKSAHSLHERRFLLLKAVTTILTALGGKEKAMDALQDDRFFELVDILAHFSFESILKFVHIVYIDLNCIIFRNGLIL